MSQIFSFIAGVMTPFPCVRIFCLYTGVSVAFIYIWHITLFAGVLALAGRAEKSNRHGLLPCIEAVPISQSKHRPWFLRYTIYKTHVDKKTVLYLSFFIPISSGQ